MTIDWNASELKIRLTPVGKPVGRKTQATSVFREYGDLKPRMVQAIADMVDGETIYIAATQKDGRVMQTIPVVGWRNGAVSDCLTCVTGFIETAFGKNLDVIVYGATRAKWSLHVDSLTMASDCLDNMTDRGLAGDGRARSLETIEANGLRSEF